MAKQCASSEAPSIGMARVEPPVSARAWQRRIFKNTYVRNGVRRQIRAWAVRIQFQGVRKTFSLAAGNRRKAALEAREIYDRILAQGWEAMNGRRARSVSPSAIRLENLAADGGAGYWKERLIYRKYSETLQPAGRNEFSVRMGDETRHEWFPLGTDVAVQAAAKAVKIYQCLKSGGWPAVCSRFPRELTVAIFWAVSPVAVTYTTIYTIVGGDTQITISPNTREKSGRTIAVIEPDAGVQRALSFWLNRQAGVRRVLAFPEIANLRFSGRNAPDLVLVNRALPGAVGIETMNRLRAQAPHLPVFAYETAEHIDHIFNSLSGVTAGYIFRRRAPAELLEPIQNALSEEVFSAEQVGQHVREYFGQLFELGVPVGGSPRISNLTERELETLRLLSKGWADKEIADALRISVWTVHSHLKNIYEKLRVHTRTEAVVKYLEK